MPLDMAPRSGTYRMADRLTGGRLAELLRAYRTAGMSWDDISRRLYGDFGVDVTSFTLQKWGTDTPDDEPEAATG